tara:strand:+ start:413 stop:739 length:327 start_codon:yes stop_codon:yes gene_type:complete
MNIPEEAYVLDEEFRDLARRTYKTLKGLKSSLKQRGLLGRFYECSNDYYLLESKDRARGIDLIFERREGLWRITEENRKRIFNQGNDNPVEYLDRLIERVKVVRLEED